MPGRAPTVLLLVLSLSAGALAGCGDDDQPAATSPPPTATTTTPAPAEPPAEEPELARTDGDPEVTTVAENLDVPWEIAFLPDGRALITERSGAIRLLTADGELRDEPVGRIEVRSSGEGGLLGLVADPAFDENRFLYAYRTTADGNQVVRLTFADGRVQEDAVIVEGIEAAVIHDGGRLRIGPDDRLYITTGDAGQPQLAQRDGLNGKVLRMDPDDYRGDGGRAEIFTTGHRNPQGLAFQPGSDRVFATEHGQSANDEVNHLRAGRNYGWPLVQGRAHGRFTAPVAVYPDMTLAPSGATFVRLPASAWTGDLLFGALAGEQIRRVQLDGPSVSGQEALLEGEFGRIRTVVEAPDGSLYALTSNTDGRGTPREGDDRVLRIIPPAG